jgi:hypothetical protein
LHTPCIVRSMNDPNIRFFCHSILLIFSFLIVLPGRILLRHI